VALKNYYELLEVGPDSPVEEIKRAFRAQIARYHPDKVHHLGKEFQSMAADRAAELTEAYRILSDVGRRADYDRAFADVSGGSSAGLYAAPPPPFAGVYQPPLFEPPSPAAPPGGQFRAEQATKDEVVRKAMVNRLRQALHAVGGGYDESPLRGFDLALIPKKQMFGRSKNPRLIVRFVPQLDRDAVGDAWAEALKWGDTKSDEVCVLLLGMKLAPAAELAGEIAGQRRKSRGARVTLIPVDARVWDAHMPLDAPAIAKTLIARLKSGS
jgi:hypothetical protein